MEKVKIIVHRENKDETFRVLVNPSDYNLQFGTRYSSHNSIGAGSQASNFLGVNNSKLSMALYVDGYLMSKDNKKPSDIKHITKKLIDLTQIDPKLHRPPLCTLVWGSLSFRGAVDSVSVKHTMFQDDGMPIRATVNISFIHIPEKGKSNIPYESPDRTKRRILSQDTQLFMLSYECYKDCGLWRHIADANNIGNPRKVFVGQVLKIPALSN